MPASSVNVLVVEDHRDTLEVLGLFLEVLGCRCKLAVDGASALRLAAGEGFDLLITDVQLGSGDGWTLIAALRERGCLPPLVASMSAGHLLTLAARSKAEGCNWHLVKPPRRNELAAVLEKAAHGDGSPLEVNRLRR